MSVTALLERPASGTRPGRIADGDLDELVREHRTPLFRHVLWLCGGDKHVAEDIVQETLLRLWQHPEALTTKHESIRPWLFTVARNLVIDHQRRRARTGEVYDAAMDRAQTDPRIDASLQAHDMLVALSRLSEEHRTVLVDTYYRGRRLADTAVALGVPLGTVKSRIYYALRALRSVTEQLGIA